MLYYGSLNHDAKLTFLNCLLLLHVAPPLLFTVTSFLVVPTVLLYQPFPQSISVQICGICAGKISQFLLHDYMYLLQYWQTAKVYGVQLTLFGSGRYQSNNNLAFNISFNLYFYDEYSRKVGKWLNIVITMLDVNRSHLAY